jgi:hypothetical protein
VAPKVAHPATIGRNESWRLEERTWRSVLVMVERFVDNGVVVLVQKSRYQTATLCSTAIVGQT